MKLTKVQKEYPSNSISLKNLKKEQWKEIPYTEGYYLLSNYGRVKALSFPTSPISPPSVPIIEFSGDVSDGLGRMGCGTRRPTKQERNNP